MNRGSLFNCIYTKKIAQMLFILMILVSGQFFVIFSETGFEPNIDVRQVEGQMRDFSLSSVTIVGDSDFSEPGSDWTGTGSEGDPYLLSNMIINLTGVSGNCIRISNTRAFFRIENCTVIGGSLGYGIILSNTTNGEIQNNTIKKNSEAGVYLAWSSNINVSLNLIRDNLDGVRVTTYSSENNIQNNTISRNSRYGIFMDATSHSNLVKCNTFDVNSYNAQDDFELKTNLFEMNFWSDYSGYDTTPRNGIGDSPYEIAGDANNLDLSPMMLPPTIPPLFWIDILDNQTARLDEYFVLRMNVTSYAGIDSWWLNDTSSFSINAEGIIINNTYLPESTSYGLRVYVNDTYSNWISTELYIEVVDISPPEWKEPLSNIVLEFGEGLFYDINATDPSGISRWWINWSTTFQISMTGDLFNSTPLEIGRFHISINVNDTKGFIRTGLLLVSVIDTIAPIFDSPTNYYQIEFGDSIEIDYNATDLAGIEIWSVNNTDFAIDENGLLTNATSLNVGEYILEISVNDTHGQVSTSILKVEVVDSTSPNWILTPADIYIFECGESVIAHFNATDLSGISHWWTNESEYFQIGSYGYLFAIGITPPGEYALEIRAYDPYGNYLSCIISVQAQDTTSPEWILAPTNVTGELGSSFRIRYIAEDIVGIDIWWLDDLENFSISSNGYVVNNTNLQVAQYHLKVLVNDTSGNILSCDLIIEISDTLAPIWINSPTNQEIIFGESLNYTVSAWDLGGIQTWMVNDTEHFSISEEGQISSNGILAPGEYNLEITVTDFSGNVLNGSLQVTVVENSFATLLIISILCAAVIGIAIISSIIYLRKHKAG